MTALVNETGLKRSGGLPVAKPAVGIAIVILVACLAGCYTQIKTVPVAGHLGEAPPPGWVEDLLVRTDRPWYDRLPSERYVTVGAVFENGSAEPVILSGCPEPPSYVIEEWEDEAWRDGLTYGIGCLAIYSTKTATISPGGSLEFEVHVQFPGWYRLRILVGPDNKNPVAAVHSNQFLIR